MWKETTQCNPTSPISVLEVHATQDPVISYDGGLFNGAQYPAAATTVADWATFNACAEGPTAGAATTLAGSATTTESYSGCTSGVSVGFWSVDIASHRPFSGAAATSQVLDWPFAHAKGSRARDGPRPPGSEDARSVWRPVSLWASMSVWRQTRGSKRSSSRRPMTLKTTGSMATGSRARATRAAS